MKVLLVEDNDDSRAVLRAMIERLGYRVVEATDDGVLRRFLSTS